MLLVTGQQWYRCEACTNKKNLSAVIGDAMKHDCKSFGLQCHSMHPSYLSSTGTMIRSTKNQEREKSEEQEAEAQNDEHDALHAIRACTFNNGQNNQRRGAF